MTSTRYRLGEFIEQLDARNTDGKYRVEDVRGIATSKDFIMTKADMDGVSLASYKVVGPGEFAFVPDTSRRGDKMSLAYNNSTSSYIVSSISCVFRVHNQDKLLPDYLYIYFNRPEFDRYARFNSWGSARETFTWEDMCDIEIDLPPIEIQKKYVDVYNAMVANQKCYEQGLEDLKLTCEGYIEDLRRKMPSEKIGPYIECINEKNNDGKIKLNKAASSDKRMVDSHAVLTGVNLNNYSIVRSGDFAYNTVTTRNGDKISIALNTEDDCLVSPIYTVFRVDAEKIIPRYLQLWFNRSEFDRYARFNSWGSAREMFTFDDMREVEIPIPDTKLQQNIADISEIYYERKNLLEEIKENIKNICPILIKGSLEEANK